MSTTKLNSILRQLEQRADPHAVKELSRLGIAASRAFGLSTPQLRTMAKSIGRNHDLALQLWETGILDARVIATLIDDPARVTEKQMERWVLDFDNWAICDACCGNLFDKTPFAWNMAVEWSRREAEFAKRAGFVIMAELAMHDKDSPDKKFIRFLPIIKRGSDDARNFVMKAVNWALRQIGKRNVVLNKKAIITARQIAKLNSPSATWISADALRELTSDAVQKRLLRKNSS